MIDFSFPSNIFWSDSMSRKQIEAAWNEDRIGEHNGSIY